MDEISRKDRQSYSEMIRNAGFQPRGLLAAARDQRRVVGEMMRRPLETPLNEAQLRHALVCLHGTDNFSRLAEVVRVCENLDLDMVAGYVMARDEVANEVADGVY